VPDPNNFRDSAANRESLYNLQGILPPQLEPSNWFETIGYYGNNPVDPYSRTGDYGKSVKEGASADTRTSPDMINNLLKIFIADMISGKKPVKDKKKPVGNDYNVNEKANRFSEAADVERNY